MFEARLGLALLLSFALLLHDDLENRVLDFDSDARGESMDGVKLRRLVDVAGHHDVVARGIAVAKGPKASGVEGVPRRRQ